MYIVKPDVLKTKQDVVLLDCRFVMTEPAKGRLLYDEGHIIGASYVDLDKDLVAEIGEHGGRHPLLDLDIIKAKMESLGVAAQRPVFIYDSGEMPMAAVLWFVLQLLGIDAYVIAGGFAALVAAGFEVTREAPQVRPAKITTEPRLHLRADLNDALRSIDDSSVVLVDARANERYLGLTEPFDRIAGHIPGALNIFWKDLFDENHNLKDEVALANIFAPLDNYKEVIFQCGSGISGAVNLLVYHHIGKKGRLYSGSYSDYISYPGNKLIVKDGKEIIL